MTWWRCVGMVGLLACVILSCGTDPHGDDDAGGASDAGPDALALDESPEPETTPEVREEADTAEPVLPPWCAPPGEDAATARERIFAGDEVPVIALAVSPEAWSSLETEPRVWTEATLSYADAHGTWGPLPVAVRLKGGGGGDPADGSFQPLDGKPAFKVDMNRVMTCGHLYGLTKLTLNNMVQDPTMLRERLAYRLARQAGVPAARSAYAWVTLNGAPLGLYAHVESYDQGSFLDAHFPSTGHLYEEHIGSDLRPEDISEFDVDRGPEEDRSDLEAVVQALASSTADLMGDTAEVIAWEPTLRAMVMEQLLGHWDGYASNAHNVFFHLTAEGQLTLLPWGLDQALFFQGPGLHQGRGLLFLRCMQDTGCRQVWNLVVGELVGLFESVPQWVGEELSLLQPQIAMDPRRPWTLEEHEMAVVQLLDFVSNRSEFAASAIACASNPDLDLDQDGHPCLSDCDDQSPSTHPGAEEVCDPPWQDENCDGDFGGDCAEDP